MNRQVEYEAPSWNQIYVMLLNVADKIRNSSFRPDIIIGVSRGGWPPARVLSDLLSNPNLASVTTELYVGVAETKDKAALTQPMSAYLTGKKALIVDEVVDTGKSLKLAREHMIERGAMAIRIATLYHKPWSIVKPDYSEKKTSCWIVFPWEIKETIRNIIRKCGKDGLRFEREKARLVVAGIPEVLINRFSKEITEEDEC